MGEAQALGDVIRAVAEMGEVHGIDLAFSCRGYYTTSWERGQGWRGILHNSSLFSNLGLSVC